jgi:D-alanyl-D-alanine carboxypeptidase (penicillin-binding protein 5/6)
MSNILPSIKLHHIVTTALSLGIVALLVAGVVEREKERKVAVREAQAVAARLATSTVPSPFALLEIDAEAAVVWDVAAERALYARHADAQLPLASLTKLMTALVADEKINPPVILTIKRSFLTPEGENGLEVGERWRSSDLLGFTLLVSSNDGARALAAAAASGGKPPALEEEASATDQLSAFIASMNERAVALGLTQTFFLNESGLDTSEAMSGGYGSAQDVARLMAAALREIPEVLDMTRDDSITIHSLSGIIHEKKNTNEATGRIPGLIGGKTGYTELAGGNLAVVFDAGIAHPIAVVVLGSTADGRFRDVEELAWKTLEYLRVCTMKWVVCT